MLIILKFEIIEKIQEKTKMNKEANVLTMVLIGKVKLHKYNNREVKSVLLSPTANCLRPLSLGSIGIVLSQPKTQLLENTFTNIKNP